VNHRHLLPDEIDLLLDGEVGFGVAPLRAHVRQCAECRRELDEARAVVAALDSLPHFSPSPAFSNRVMAQVQVFEPWHVAALDWAKRFVPQSRPARVVAAAGGLSAAFVLSVVSVWLLARFDILVFMTNIGLDRLRSGLVHTADATVSSLLGPAAGAAVRSGDALTVALVATGFLVLIVAAAAGLKAVAALSRRHQRS
jgi:hypothetical protein